MAQEQRSAKTNEIAGVILIGLAALFATSVYFGISSPFGTFVHRLVFGLFGVMGYLFPVILGLIGVLFIAAKKKTIHAGKLMLLSGVLLIIFTMCHLSVTSVLFMEGESYGQFLLDSYRVGMTDMQGGGLLGGLLAFWLHALLGSVGSWIACICILVVCALALTNLSLKKISLDIGSAVKTGYRDMRGRFDERQLERRDQEKLYVESLNAKKAAAQRQVVAADPFNLRIQSLDPPRRRKSKRFSKAAPAPKKNPSLDLRVFEPSAERHGNTAPLSGALRASRIEPHPDQEPELVAELEVSQSLTTEEKVRKLDEECPASLVDQDSTAVASTSDAGEEYDPSPYREVFSDTDIEFDEETVYEQRGKRRIDAHVADAHKGNRDEKPPQVTQELGSYHVQTGSRAGTAAVVAADADAGGPAPMGSYRFPPLELLDIPAPSAAKSRTLVQENARRLEETLKSFHIEAHVVDILQGPVVTRYELQPAPGVKVSRIVQLADDIALNLAAKSIRIEAPVPGKSVIGIEVPNAVRESVGLRELLEDEKYQNMKSPIAFALGKDITGTNVFADIAKMPHLLVAGQTGSGKSVCINSLIVSLLYHASPDDVRLMMIDPKVVELSVFNNIPHLIAPVVTDPKKANLALNWAVAEMESRYRDFAKHNVKELKRYNEVLTADGEKRLPHVVVIVDELADLMMTSSSEVEEAITRIAQKGRAAGIHLVIATQRPTVNVVTGLIKANVPARVALSVKSSIDSKTILDTVGAEKLLGYGDMLFYTTGLSNPERIQGCWVSDKEVERVAQFLYTAPEEIYDSAVQEKIESGGEEEEEHQDRDALFKKAAEIALDSEGASTSLLQRRLKIGYSRAARLIDQLEEEGIVSGQNGSKPRQVLISREDLDSMFS